MGGWCRRKEGGDNKEEGEQGWIWPNEKMAVIPSGRRGERGFAIFGLVACPEKEKNLDFLPTVLR